MEIKEDTLISQLEQNQQKEKQAMEKLKDFVYQQNNLLDHKKRLKELMSVN